MKVRLDQLLVDSGLFDTRSAAREAVRSGQVRVNGASVQKPGQQLDPSVQIAVDEQTDAYVSRAGKKLAGANAHFGVDFTGRTVLDIGASTGGFSDYALRQGAHNVYAVDVGTNQLHPRLRANDKVTAMEQTDIRDVQLKNTKYHPPAGEPNAKILPMEPDIALVDVSFISLRLVLPSVVSLMKTNGIIIAMAKPQFEAGAATKHKGVIKNDRLRRRIFQDFETWLKQHDFFICDKIDSEIPGSKGNRERFYLLKLSI